MNFQVPWRKAAIKNTNELEGCFFFFFAAHNNHLQIERLNVQIMRNTLFDGLTINLHCIVLKHL